MTVPKLRFKEFNATYKTILFGDLVTNKSDKYNPLLNEQPFKCIELEHMDSNTGSLNGFTDSRLQASIKNVFNPDSVLYGKLRPYLNKFYYTNFSGVCSSEIWVLSSLDNNKLINPYLYYLIQTSKYSNLAAQSTGSKMPRADWSILSETDFEIPVIEEQKKISSFLKKIDVRIQLQQEKIDLLKEQKKGFMQKIFSQELRFKDEDGKAFPEWEEKNLSSLIKVNSGRDYKHLGPGNISVYGTGGYMLSVNQSLSEVDSIGIGRKGTIDVPQILKAPFWTVDTLFYCTPTEATNLQFVYTLFEKIKWKSFDESTGVPSLSKKTIENIIIQLPNTQEQRKIGAFFERLNIKIDYQVKKLQEMNIQKQAFMQQMFI